MFNSPKIQRGFSLVELLITASLLLLIMLFSVPYLFGTKEKTQLLKATKELVYALTLAQETSQLAKHGRKYKVVFLDTSIVGSDIFANGYQIQDDSDSPLEKEQKLPNAITLTLDTDQPIEFDKLTGKTSIERTLRLYSTSFQTTITVRPIGVIISSPAEAL